jgi:hypothetical protein
VTRTGSKTAPGLGGSESEGPGPGSEPAAAGGGPSRHPPPRCRRHSKGTRSSSESRSASASGHTLHVTARRGVTARHVGRNRGRHGPESSLPPVQVAPAASAPAAGPGVRVTSIRRHTQHCRPAVVRVRRRHGAVPARTRRLGSSPRPLPSDTSAAFAAGIRLGDG